MVRIYKNTRYSLFLWSRLNWIIASFWENFTCETFFMTSIDMISWHAFMVLFINWRCRIWIIIKQLSIRFNLSWIVWMIVIFFVPVLRNQVIYRFLSSLFLFFTCLNIHALYLSNEEKRIHVFSKLEGSSDSKGSWSPFSYNFFVWLHFLLFEVTYFFFVFFLLFEFETSSWIFCIKLRLWFSLDRTTLRISSFL